MANHRLSPSPMDDAHDDGAWSQDQVDRQWVQDEIDSRIAAWQTPRKRPTILVRGTVIAATMLALAAAGYGITATKGATHTAPLTATPPTIPAPAVPATVDPIPDAAMDVPPVLTPSLVQHGHPSRLLHSQTTTVRVQPTADTATAPQLAAVPVPEVAPAPVQAAVVPEQTPTVQEPQPTATWVPQYAYPTFQPQRRYGQRSGSSGRHHHGHSYDFDHDGDNH